MTIDYGTLLLGQLEQHIYNLHGQRANLIFPWTHDIYKLHEYLLRLAVSRGSWLAHAPTVRWCSNPGIHNGALIPVSITVCNNRPGFI